MAGTPFYEIFIKNTDEDVSDIVTRFLYEESVDEDDMLRLSVKKVDKQEVIGEEDNVFPIGTEIVFQFGYRQGQQSGARLARVTGRPRTYDSAGLSLSIIATDLGLLMKKAKRYDDWSGSTASQIVRRIADRNGFLLNIGNTNESYSLMHQGGRTDWEFLKYLAGIQPSGKYRVYMKGDTLNFNERDLGKEPSKSYDYANSDFISFAVDEKDNTKNPASKSIGIKSVNPITGDLIEKQASGDAKTETSLAGYTVHINARGEESYSKPSKAQKAKQDTVGDKAVGGGGVEPSEIQGEANSATNKAALEDITATLKTIGEPLAKADTVITMQGVMKSDSGNWYISKVTHDISGNSSYTTTHSLKRNATEINTKAGGNSKVEKKNSKIGPNESKQTNTTIVIDEDGNEFSLNG